MNATVFTTTPARFSLAANKVWLETTAGILGLLLFWQLTVNTGFSAHDTIPSPAQILRQFFIIDGPGFYFHSAASTMHAATQGWLWGVGLAIALGMLLVLLPSLETPVMLLGTVSYCMPMVAIGPVLVVVASGDLPRVTLAAIAVFFPMLVGTHLGLRSASPAMLDLIRAYGGGAFTHLTKVRLRAALPQFFASLRVSAPAAILGSIIGEFLGAENGLGVVLINSQQGANYPRTWTVSLFSAVLAGVAYGLIRLLGAYLTPWAREAHSNLAATTAKQTSGTHRGC